MTRRCLISAILCFLLVPICPAKAGEIKESDKWVNKVFSDEKLTKEEIRGTLEKYDLSTLFTHTEHYFVYGFIGGNFQRLRIHFVKVRRNEKHPNQYKV